MDIFLGFLERLAFSLGGRALSFFLRGLGCSGGLIFAIAFSLKIFFTEEIESIRMMASSGSHSGGSIKSVPQDEICRELEKESTSVGTSSGGKGKQNLNLNVKPNPHQAMHEVRLDIKKAEHHLDELMAREPSLRDAGDIYSIFRDIKKFEQLLSETKLRLDWAVEVEEEDYAAKSEESAGRI